MFRTGSEAVLDASAIVRSVVSAQPDATSWLRQAAKREVLAVAPDHLHAEIGNALRRLVRGGLLEFEAANDRLSYALDLPIKLFPARLLAPQALTLSVARGISVYDALYLALALGYGAPLVTADRRLAAAAGAAACLLPPV